MESKNESKKASDGMVAWLVIAIVFFGVGFGISRYTCTSCTAPPTDKSIAAPLTSYTIPTTTFTKLMKSSNPADHYETYLIDYKVDSNLNGVKVFNNNENMKIQNSGGIYTLVTPTTAPASVGADFLPVNYYALTSYTIGYYMDLIYGLDHSRHDSMVAFRINDVVRIKRGNTDGSGTVVFGVVNIENTGIY